MRSLINRLLEVIYPHRCLLCGASERLKPGVDACFGCLGDLPTLGPSCLRCADSLVAAPGSPILCGACLAKPPAFARSICLGPYAGGFAALITGLKFRGEIVNARLLGHLLGRRLALQAKPTPASLVPVPLHPKRLRRRGYNQAREIAGWAARECGIPLRTDLVIRQRHTPAQAGLKAAVRRANLRGAFHCRKNPGRQPVAIIDDVMTTGATAESLAVTLLRAGCAEVEVWCCARARLGDGPSKKPGNPGLPGFAT